MHQFDIKTVFLHSPIAEKVYLEQLQEFVKQGSDGEKLVCRMNKSIYVSKQSANNRYKELANFLLRQGFIRSRNDPCLFASAETEGHNFNMVWFDEIIVASRSLTVISDVKKEIETTFRMEDSVRLHWFLGPRIRPEVGKVRVDQERYIETMLEWVQMDQCKPSRTPADLILKLQTAQIGDEEVEQRIYKSLLGSLLYLTKQARPGIMFTVNTPSRHMNAPNNQHWLGGNRLLRYLQVSKRLKLTYTKEASYDLVGESDADWCGNVNDRKPTAGYYFKLNGRCAALSWVVKKQATVAHSSLDAEYQGIAAADQEALYLKQLLEDFGIQLQLERTTRIVSNCAKTQSCTRRANTLRQNFTSFGTRHLIFLLGQKRLLFRLRKPITQQYAYKNPSSEQFYSKSVKLAVFAAD